MFTLGDLKNAQRPEAGKPREFKPLEPGVYFACVEEAEPRKANTGTDYVAIKFSIKDVNQGNKGFLFYNLYMTEKTLWVADQFLKAIGIDINELGLPDSTFLQPDQLATMLRNGRMCIHVVNEESTYNGQTKTKATINPWGSPMAGAQPEEKFSYWYGVIVEGKDPDAPEADEFMMDGVSDDEEDVEF